MALVFLAVAGAADFVSAVLRGNILLSATPDSLRGRLSGIELAQVAGAPEIGNVEAGVVASLAGVRASIVSGGVLTVVGTAVIAAAFCLPSSATTRASRRRNEARPRLLRPLVHDVAPELIGVTLLVDGVGGPIVEVEAYDHEDPAAHGFGGRTERNARCSGRPATRTCTARTASTGASTSSVRPEGVASAVLIRALEPTHGSTRWPRDAASTIRACSPAGPGRLCQALGVTREQDGAPLDRPPFELYRARGGRSRRRAAHRDHEGGRPPVALRGSGLAVRQPADQARPAILTVIPGAAATPRPRQLERSTRPAEPPCDVSSTSMLRPRRSHLR